LKPDAVSVALVGNAAVFGPQLRGVGFGNFETIPVDNLDLLTADFKRAAGAGKGVGTGRIGRANGPVLALAGYEPLPQRPVAVDEGEKARTLLDAVIAAKGGLQTLRGIRTIKASMTASMSVPGQSDGAIEARTTTYLEYPDHVRLETKGPQGMQIQVFDGKRGWVQDPAGTHDVPEAALKDMAASLKRDTVTALLAAARGELRPRLLPDVKTADGALHRALELSSPMLEPLVLYVDPRTHLIAKQAYVVNAPGRPLVEEVFSDYRPIDGLTVAFTAEVRTDGRPVVRRRLDDITINGRIDPKLFTRPN
jgi:hypothetical protein